jgi:3-dehydroquinate synthase class II
LASFAGDKVLVGAGLAGHFVQQGDGLRLGRDDVVVCRGALEKLRSAVDGDFHVAEHDERADIKVVGHAADGKLPS